MKFIERKAIDSLKWDTRIQQDAIENIFLYSWYLDATAENWGALVSNDYKTILPIPYTIRLGVRQIYQPVFTREVDIIGDDYNWEDVYKYLQTHFKVIAFRHQHKLSLGQPISRKYQYINIGDDFAAQFKTNAKRLVKKADKVLEYESSDNMEILIDLFKDNVAHKIESFGENELVHLHQLLNAAINHKKGLLYIAKDNEDNIHAAGFFLFDKTKITYLKGAGTDAAKKSGAMFGLFNYVLNTHQSKFKTLDFGGSEIEGVANFFRKFGASNQEYFSYTLDNSPFWFKFLKKLKHR